MENATLNTSLSLINRNKKNLPEYFNREIKSLSGARPKLFIIEIIKAWTMIMMFIAISLKFENIAIDFISFFIISTRMNILGLLVHEQSHALGIRQKYGNLIVNILCAFPLGITVEDYKKVHLMHHKYFFTENDPDFNRKSGKNWNFPKLPFSFFVLFLRDFFVISFFEILKGKRVKKEKTNFNYSAFFNLITRVLFYTLLLYLIFINGLTVNFLKYWIVPLIFFFPILVRIGALCEHIYTPNSNLFENTPIIIPTLWEKVLLPDLNFKYHLYHHLHPNVSFSNLEKIHKIYTKENIINKKYVFKGLIEYFSFLQAKPSNK